MMILNTLTRTLETSMRGEEPERISVQEGRHMNPRARESTQWRPCLRMGTSLKIDTSSKEVKKKGRMRDRKKMMESLINKI